MKAEMVMKKENNKWYIGWIIFPAWYLIGKKYIILPVIQSVFEAMSYSDAYLITNYLWNLIAPIDGIKCINPNNTDDTITLIIRLLLIELNINHLKISSSNIGPINAERIIIAQ